MISVSKPKSVQTQELMIVAALVLLVALSRLPSLEQPFDNDSGANAYHARLILRNEPLYGTHHPMHHMPAVYYVYALAFFLFGDSVWAVKFLLVLWILATAYVLYRLGRLLAGRKVGFLAAFIYVLLTSHVYMMGVTAEIELFANLPRVAAVWLLISNLAADASPRRFILVGLLSAAAFLFKAVYLSPLALTGCLLLAEVWRTRTEMGVWRKSISRGLWFVVGFAAGLLCVGAYFAALGLLPRFLLVFTLGKDYLSLRASTAGPAYVLLYPLFGLAINNVVLLLLSLVGLAAVTIEEVKGHQPDTGKPVSMMFSIGIWYVLSFLEAGVSRVLFLHYYLLIVPPLACLAAWSFVKIYQVIYRRDRALNRFVALFLPLALLAITLSISFGENFDYYRHYVRYKLGLATYQDFLLKGWPAEGQHLVRVQELADYIKMRTSPADRIFYWSGDVQIYYLADRRAPIETVWPLYAEATGPYQRIFSPQTEYIIVGTSNTVPRPEWLYAELARAYQLETVISDQEVYRRVE